MQVGQLYIAELCYLCQKINSESAALGGLAVEKINQYERRNRFIPWGRDKALDTLNAELAVINENLKFRRELLEKLYSSVGGGDEEKVTLLEILQRGGNLI